MEIESLNVRVVPRDVINGWEVVEQVRPEPLRARQWKLRCTCCEAERVVTEALVVHDGLQAHCTLGR